MNMYFILWMLLFPVSVSICSYIDSKYSKKEYKQETHAISGLFILITWFYVGYLLF